MFLFLRNQTTGVVHLVEDQPSWQREDRAISTDPASVMLALFTGNTTARCGVVISRNRGGLDQGGAFTDSFADEDLCQRCHATLHTEDEIEAAFSHAQPEE